jgi:hypothetical protein
MKCILSFILFLLLTNLTASNSDYLAYYKVDNKAQIQLVNGNYDSAVVYYDSAFALSEPLIKDLYNAAICCQITGDYYKGASWLYQLANKGVKKKVITKSCFKKLRKEKYWKENVGNKLDSIITNAIHLRNIVYQNKVDSLYSLDQKYRKKAGSYKVYGDTIAFLDSLNMKGLINLINRYGYPGEKTLGKDTPSKMNNAYIIIRHHYQNKKDISKLLYQALLNGNISPYMYAELEDKKSSWNNSVKYGSLVFLKYQWGINKKLLIELNYSEKQLKEIEKERAKIGLPDNKNFKKMILKRYKLKRKFIFNYYEGLVFINAKPSKK